MCDLTLAEEANKYPRIHNTGPERSGGWKRLIETNRE